MLDIWTGALRKHCLLNYGRRLTSRGSGNTEFSLSWTILQRLSSRTKTMLYKAVLLLAVSSASTRTWSFFASGSPIHKGCGEGLWGDSCQKLCSAGCLAGCEQQSGKCIDGCGPGWTGTNCESMCASYRYGFNCVNSCGHCYDDKPCNIATGRCGDGCIAGFRGEKCDQGCKPFTYGANCNLTCGHCRQDQACNTVTGQCPGGCDRGWVGRTCEGECSEGYFGIDCVEPCAHCAGNSTCHHVTGNCAEGCAPGWAGPQCNIMCHPGSYGSDCRETCGQCLKGACNPITGECFGGCSRGYRGAQCKEECPSGWYGENCSIACGHCKSGSKCDRATGFCLGCTPGWQGAYCLQNCSYGTYGDDCKFLCGRCKGGTPCDVTTGMCLSECEEGWEGDKCDISFSIKASQSFHSSPSFPVLIISLVAAIIIISTFFTYCVVVRPRKTALRRLYNASSTDHLANTYEQIVGSPWELQRGQLSISNELLGNGQFGQVKKGHVKINGMKIPVAIKSIKADNASEKDKTDFLNELSILKRVGKNENVVCLVGACHIRGVMYVAMEYAKHGDLRTFLRQSRRLTSLHEYDNTSTPSLHTALRPQALIKLSLDTAKGLKHLADKQIIHRDVAARNVLLADKLVAKIADFGLSKNDQTYVKTSSTRVPIRWMAIESLFNNTYTLQSDVWSFGVLLWEIFTLGGTPYSSIDSQQLFKYLKDGHRLRKPRLCDQDMYSMMLQCWNDDPDRRPTIEELTARLNRMLENSQVYMNLNVQEESLYTEIDHERMNCN